MIPAALGAGALAIVAAVGTLSGAISVSVLRRRLNAEQFRTAMNRVWAHLLEFQLFAGEPVLILRAQRDLLVANARMLRLLIVPSLVLAIPFAMLLASGEAVFGHAPPRPGEVAVITLQYGSASAGNLSETSMETPPGIAIDAPAVHIPGESQISWRVRADRPASGDLHILSGGRVFTKSIAMSPGWHWLSTLRARPGLQFLLHPLEAPLPPGALQWIEIRYPPALIFHFHWSLWFALASLIGALLGALLEASLGAGSSLWGMRWRALPPGFPALLCAAVSPMLHAATISPLAARGYAVIPAPQQVTLQPDDFRFGPHWRLQSGRGVPPHSIAVESLTSELKARFGIALDGERSLPGVIVLDVAPGAVVPGRSQDSDRAAIALQAYRLDLSPARIHVVANAETGLFYGVQTLLQLATARKGALWLPVGEIVDWPDLQVRHIYWDDAHHLEKLPELTAAIRQAASFKINGFVIKLEGHFQYASAPALVEPQALSSAQLQELTEYGLRYGVQLIPYLDAPAHIAFILKHPEYSKFRAFPDSNYEMCTTDPAALRFLYGLYDDLLAANKGVNYFYLSTDEAYYAGLSNCGEAQRSKELGGPGKVLAEFVKQAAGYLHDRGRSVVFWGEYPLKPADIPALPPFLINGETYGPAFDPLYKAHGIRQMIYNATEGEEPLFPHYFLRPPAARMHVLQEDFERVPEAVSKIVSEPARQSADLRGLVIAGWGDMGLHPETFWLGYAAITAAGWNPLGAGPRETTNAFYPLFYGSEITGMDRVYRLMSEQAEIWADTWDTIDSTARKPIWGNSDTIFQPPRPAHDQTIPLPGVPSPDLRYEGNWKAANARRLEISTGATPANSELQGLLLENFRRADFHRYGLEVFLAIAQVCRQNLDLLASLSKMEDALQEADRAARANEPRRAVQAVDRALAEAVSIRKDRNSVLRDATATWYQSWLPRVPEAHGRRFLHELDDVKDHLPDRTVDMSYLVYRELLLPFEEWYKATEASRNAYARKHDEPVRSTSLEWKSLQ